MGSFVPQNIDAQLGEILPESNAEIDVNSAKSECTSTVKDLSADISGIGPKAAERYLLRYEYGFSNKELAEDYRVTSPAITKHTQSVRDRVLEYPTLAQIVGQFRAKRANLTHPAIEEGTLWEGDFDLESGEVSGKVRFHPGTISVPYSWMFTLAAAAQDKNTIRHLLVYYVVDANNGVFLKRSIKGFSHASWRRPPHFQTKWHYTVYPLPHPEIPDENGTLINAVEHHITYDVKRAFEEPDWHAQEAYLKSNPDLDQDSAGNSLPDVLLDRIRQENSIDAIFDYSQKVHRRDNMEHILRLYPLINPRQIPLDTTQLLWNGPLRSSRSSKATREDFDTVLATMEISRKPGPRII